MRHEQQGGPRFLELADAFEAFVLEVGIANRQGLIDDEDVGTQRRGDAEGQTHLHAAGVHADGLIDVVADFGKGFNLGHEAVHVLRRISQQLAGHHGILATSEIRMEAHAQFEQGSHPAVNAHRAGGGLYGAGDELEQGALSCPVDPDDADGFTRGYCERDIVQHPFQTMSWGMPWQHPFGKPPPARVILLVGLAQACDGEATHYSSSTSSPTWRRNRPQPHRQSTKASNSTGHSRLQSGQVACSRIL